MASVVVLGVFAVLELRTPGPLLDVRVFKVPRFTVGATSISIAFFALFGFIFLITQYFQLVRGYSALSAGVARSRSPSRRPWRRRSVPCSR